MKNIDDEIKSTKQQIEQLAQRQDRLVSKLKVEERKNPTLRWYVCLYWIGAIYDYMT